MKVVQINTLCGYAASVEMRGGFDVYKLWFKYNNSSL